MAQCRFSHTHACSSRGSRRYEKAPLGDAPPAKTAQIHEPSADTIGFEYQQLAAIFGHTAAIPRAVLIPPDHLVGEHASPYVHVVSPRQKQPSIRFFDDPKATVNSRFT